VGERKGGGIGRREKGEGAKRLHPIRNDESNTGKGENQSGEKGGYRGKKALGRKTITTNGGEGLVGETSEEKKSTLAWRGRKKGGGTWHSHWKKWRKAWGGRYFWSAI